MTQTVNFQDMLDSGLRAQLAYLLSDQGWSITEQLGWRGASPQTILIHEVAAAEVNILIELDHARQMQWIAIRGSSNLRNWILNLQYLQRPCRQMAGDLPCGGVDLHQGFRQAAAAVYSVVLPHLHRGYQTRLTGHSLGGAIAAILMIFLQEAGYPVEQCITFGQPKVTDRQGAAQLKHLPLLRVVHNEDIVPLLPPGTPLTTLQGGYAHFGFEVNLQPHPAHTRTPSSPTLMQPRPGFWRSLLRTATQKDLSELTTHLQDHDLALYLHSILNHLQTPPAAMVKDRPPTIADLMRPEATLPIPQAAV